MIGAIIAFAIVLAGVLTWPLFAPLRHRVERPPAAVPALELVALPLVLEGQIFVGQRIATVSLMVLAVFALVRRADRVPRTWVILAMLVTFGLPLARPIDPAWTVLGWAIPILGLVVLFLASQRRSMHSFVSSLLDGVGLYLLVNVVAYYVLHIASPAAVQRTGGLEATTGGMRVIFPIATSLAVPAAMAAIYVAGAAVCLERSGPVRRTFRIIALGCAFIVLLGANTRAAIVVAGLLLVLSVVSTRVMARAATTVTVVSIAFAFVFGTTKAAVGWTINGLLSLVPSLSRGDRASDLTLNFRSAIWADALDFWTHWVTMPERLLGFGIRGQQQSGASQVYAAKFAGLSADPETISVHNSSLQQLYDAGIVGLAAFAALLIYATRWYARALRSGEAGAQVALPALLAAVTTGITEVTIAPGYLQAPLFVVAGLVLMAGSRVREPMDRTLGRSRVTEGAR